jgi:hypothetical protein
MIRHNEQGSSNDFKQGHGKQYCSVFEWRAGGEDPIPQLPDSKNAKIRSVPSAASASSNLDVAGAQRHRSERGDPAVIVRAESAVGAVGLRAHSDEPAACSSLTKEVNTDAKDSRRWPGK